MAAMNELPIPELALRDDGARELIRVWGADGAQHVSLATGVWRDPGAWGIVLADLAKHLARAYEETEGIAETNALRRIREALEAEWEAPTDEPSGGVVR